MTLNSWSMRQATRPPRTWEGILRSRSLTPAFLRQGPRLQPPQSLPHGQGATRQSAGGSGRGPAARVGLQACSRPSRSVAPQQGLGWRGVWVRTGTADAVSPRAAGPGGARRGPAQGPALLAPPWPEARRGRRAGGDGVGWFHFLHFTNDELRGCPVPWWTGNRDQHSPGLAACPSPQAR